MEHPCFESHSPLKNYVKGLVSDTNINVILLKNKINGGFSSL